MSDLPERASIQLYKDKHKELYKRVRQRAAADLDVKEFDLTRVDVFEWAAKEVLDGVDGER